MRRKDSKDAYRFIPILSLFVVNCRKKGNKYEAHQTPHNPDNCRLGAYRLYGAGDEPEPAGRTRCRAVEDLGADLGGGCTTGATPGSESHPGRDRSVEGNGRPAR